MHQFRNCHGRRATVIRAFCPVFAHEIGLGDKT
jgi:hypothetical protein